MDSQNYALLDASGVVINVVMWDGAAPYQPGEGHSLDVLPDGAGVGWMKHADGSWSPPDEG